MALRRRQQAFVSVDKAFPSLDFRLDISDRCMVTMIVLWELHLIRETHLKTGYVLRVGISSDA